ncbi:hypothetical protein JC221_178 [Yersinia phage JC221]|nr:hypothetical protein JC221_178 [Yersinia phage JC221]
MILFDFNDVFANFSDAVFAKFGKRPEEMTKAEYDSAMSSVVRTTFYQDLVRNQTGIDLLKWAIVDRKYDVALILVNEVKSPTWVNREKITFLDNICDELGLYHIDFSTCATEAEIKLHVSRGPFVTRSNTRRKLWDSAGGYLSAGMYDDLSMCILGVEQSLIQHK